MLLRRWSLFYATFIASIYIEYAFLSVIIVFRDTSTLAFSVLELIINFVPSLLGLPILIISGIRVISEIHKISAMPTTKVKTVLIFGTLGLLLRIILVIVTISWEHELAQFKDSDKKWLFALALTLVYILVEIIPFLVVLWSINVTLGPSSAIYTTTLCASILTNEELI
jgi:hypothetical protein